jgi:hypothetical protein
LVQVKLTGEEKKTILNALSIARIFYEKTKRKEEYFQVEDLFELLFFEKEITVSLSEQDVTCYLEDAKRLDTILKEREARVSAPEGGCRVYQFRAMPEGPDDPDDPDEVAADRYFSVKMKEIAKEHPEI